MIYNTLAEAQRLQQPNLYFVKEDYNLKNEDLNININLERERRGWLGDIGKALKDVGEAVEEHITDPIKETVFHGAQAVGHLAGKVAEVTEDATSEVIGAVLGDGHDFVEKGFDDMNKAVGNAVEKVDDFVDFDSVGNIIANPMAYLNPLGTLSKILTQTNFQGDEFRKCDSLGNFDQALSANDKIRRPFSYHIMSDPQLYWDHGKEGDNRDAAEKYNGNLASALNKYRDSRGQKPTSVIINGDLTAFFHPNQLQSFREIYHNSDSTLQYNKVYLGLGNHDIENNLKKGCKWTTLLDLPNLAFGGGDASCSLAAMEFADKNLRCETGGWKAQGTTLRAYNRKAHAYAWIDNGIYFIQLNWYMEKVSPDPLGFSNADKLTFLENQLKKAKTEGIPVVLNVHSNHGDIRAITKKYNDTVVAVFSGHYHGRMGFMKDEADSTNGIPSFRSSSADFEGFLVLEFDSNNKGEVKLYNTTTATPDLQQTTKLSTGSTPLPNHSCEKIKQQDITCPQGDNFQFENVAGHNVVVPVQTSRTRRWWNPFKLLPQKPILEIEKAANAAGRATNEVEKAARAAGRVANAQRQHVTFANGIEKAARAAGRAANAQLQYVTFGNGEVVDKVEYKCGTDSLQNMDIDNNGADTRHNYGFYRLGVTRIGDTISSILEKCL
eukprot:Pgem_evm1s9647